MTTVNYVIVEVDQAYVNTVNEGGLEIQVNTTIESVSHMNRVAKVIEAPEWTILQSGDEIVIHHNIVREKYTTDGRKIKGDFHIEDNMYFVPLGEIFMYRRDGSDFQAIAPYTFVKPIEKEDKMVGGFIISASESNSHKGMVKLQGIMAYPNQDLINQGVKAGDRIAFSPYSEYEFNLNGEIYYKMSTKDILAVL